ncbi:DegT/DnrJ/EryC1/StrS aminotransferase family protein [Nemorincola caseinilytica]|uniref:DegT/DnrJ/EryC1/StrS aminotransferase family protein n=2 Tax=Nemorincola caseinilytica TaxID=2054315 RepID=A0ABP8N512_9BACT
MVERFEKEFEERFGGGCAPLAVGSGTDALHLAYLLAGIQAGDEVIAPVFTCTATNIPFLYMGATIRFADVEKGTLNIDVDHVKRLITPRTKAIVCVHYGGLPCNMDELHALAHEHGLIIIEDAAHALGATYKGKKIGEISHFTMYSFQAIKHVTTADGGMLLIKDRDLLEKAKRLRWFGIDRSAKQKGIWENDITEIGYKYQMNDMAAAMGIAGLEEFNDTLALRRRLLARYFDNLKDLDGVKCVGEGYTDREHAAWMMTIIAERRIELQAHLRANGIESGQVHYRNDRYSIFGGRQQGAFPNMDKLEDSYLVLPLHTKMNETHVDRICDVMKKGW